MTPLACQVCGEPVIPVNGSTKQRDGIAHDGYADHEVVLGEVERVNEPIDVSVYSRDDKSNPSGWRPNL